MPSAAKTSLPIRTTNFSSATVSGAMTVAAPENWTGPNAGGLSMRIPSHWLGSALLPEKCMVDPEKPSPGVNLPLSSKVRSDDWLARRTSVTPASRVSNTVPWSEPCNCRGRSRRLEKALKVGMSIIPLREPVPRDRYPGSFPDNASVTASLFS